MHLDILLREVHLPRHSKGVSSLRCLICLVPIFILEEVNTHYIFLPKFVPDGLYISSIKTAIVTPLWFSNLLNYSLHGGRSKEGRGGIHMHVWGGKERGNATNDKCFLLHVAVSLLIWKDKTTVKCLAVNQEGFVTCKRQFSKLKIAKDSPRHRRRETLQQAENQWDLMDNFPRKYVSMCCQAVMRMT